jgi:membrane protein insertase Oxa1/YidC/SpoIIIJ
MKDIYKRHGCTKTRIILPPVVQIPVFILVALALRAMTGWTGYFDVGMGSPMEPLLRTEGFGAILDLTRPDGTFILPVIIGLLSVTNVEVELEPVNFLANES